MTHNRKREREPKEDETEFMPLSKRINNLHINNSSLLMESSNQSSSMNPLEWGPGPPNYNNYIPESPPSSEQSVDYNLLQFQTEYMPDLSENQNPHYFKINKLLFEMFIQRVQRGFSNV